MPPPTQPTIREHPPRCCAQCIKPPTLLHPRPPQTAPGRPERTKHDTSLSSRSTRHQVAPCSLILGPLLAPFWYPWYHHYIVLDPVGAKMLPKWPRQPPAFLPATGRTTNDQSRHKQHGPHTGTSREETQNSAPPRYEIT